MTFIRSCSQKFVAAMVQGALFLGTLLPLGAQSPQARNYPVALGYPQYYDQKRTMYAALGTSSRDIVLAGDDFIDRGMWAEMYANPRLKNRGIAGDHLYGLDYRLDEILRGRPEKIFLYIGKRDLNAGMSPSLAASYLGDIVRRIRTASRRTKVYVLSLFPDCRTDSVRSERYRAYNRLLAQIPGTRYVDIASALRNEAGALDPAFYYGSSLQLNGAGYQTVCQALQPYLGTCALDTAALANDPADSLLRGYVRERHSLIARLPVERDDILMIGNSITQGGNWDELFGNPSVKNRGINSDVTDGILARLPRTLRACPDKVFLMAGINDLGNPPQRTEEYTLEHILKVVSQIHRHWPETRVYVQSILPVNPVFPTFASHTVFTDQVVRINRALAQAAAEHDYVFIDLHSHFTDADGHLDRRYTNDGLHLCGQGYLLWRELLLPYVKEP